MDIMTLEQFVVSVFGGRLVVKVWRTALAGARGSLWRKHDGLKNDVVNGQTLETDDQQKHTAVV